MTRWHIFLILPSQLLTAEEELLHEVYSLRTLITDNMIGLGEDTITVIDVHWPVIRTEFDNS